MKLVSFLQRDATPERCKRIDFYGGIEKGDYFDVSGALPGIIRRRGPVQVERSALL